jgi:cytochrome c oxidase assembly protein subunit 11
MIRRRRAARDIVVAFACGGFVAFMVGVSFAAVPLYSWFCRTTGFGGTTQVAKTAPDQSSGRMITVRFDSNVAPGLPWSFEPERRTIDVRLGEVVTVYYAVKRIGAGDDRTSGLQRDPADGRGLFREDQLFLLHPADAAAG